MADNFKLYYNNSDPNKCVKMLDMKYSCSIKLLETTDMLRPRIILSTAYNVRECNYFYIADFNRYYFITKIDCDKQRYIIEGRCDVLTSHYKDLKNQTVIVKRAESESLMNMYLNDPKFVLLNMSRIQLKRFDNGFRYNGNKVKNFILTINGSGQSSTPPTE